MDLYSELKNRFWRNVFDYVPFGMLFLSRDGDILEINRTLLELLGVDRKEIFRDGGALGEEIFGRDNRDAISGILSKSPNESRLEIKSRKKDSVISFDLYSRNVGRKGDPVFLVVLEDITEKMTQQELAMSRLKNLETGFSLSRAALEGVCKKIDCERSRLNEMSVVCAAFKDLFKSDEEHEDYRSLWEDSYVRSVLSKREYQVLMLIKEGLKLREVAEISGIDVRTVGTYKSRALRKLKVRNRADLDELLNRIGP